MINKILIIRNDKIGDFVLSLPAIKQLKQSCHDTHITVLIPEYTSDLAKLFPYIDNIIIEPKNKSVTWLKKVLQKQAFDAVIVLYSSFYVALACFLAKIKIRIAPATKWFQFFYNYRIKQQRSQSLKPEYEYNNDLVRFYIDKFKKNQVINPKQPYLQINPDKTNQIKFELLKEYSLDKKTNLVIIHSGSGGSAKNLTKEQYALLAKRLSNKNNCIIFTAGPDELKDVKEISKSLNDIRHIVYHSEGDLKSFVAFISISECFIGGSTGPLHIAGALNKKIVGFYPNRKSATSLRWKTLSDEENILAFSPPNNADKEDMTAIDIKLVSEKIRNKWSDLFK